MATRFAIANGNFSNPLIWDNGTVPVAGDYVYANGFTVTLDTNITVDLLSTTTAGFNGSSSINVLVPDIATPVMTSNNTPSGSVTASTGANPYLAFDQATSTGNWATTILNTGWLAYQFASSKTIRRYAFIGVDVNRLPRTWTFEGSNDGVTWAVLNTQTNLTLVANTWYSYTIASPAAYTWYRINVTATFAVSNPVGIAELQMTESSGTVLGNSQNGVFNLNGGLTITCTNSTALGGIVNPNTGGTTIAFTTGTSVINSNMYNANSSGAGIALNGTGTLTINGNITATNSASAPVIRANAAATLNINGNIIGSLNSVGQCISSSGGGGSVLNIVGNVTAVGGATINAFFPTVNITGNLIGGGSAALNILSGQTVVVTGNVTGSGSSPAISSSANMNLTVNGTVTATAAQPAISSTATGANVVVNGNLVNNINGMMAVYSSRLQISPAANQTWYMTTSGGADRTLYTTGLMPPSGGYPAVGDVRSGVSYGAGLYTGTCVIPAANTVALGVPVDTTFGTAVLPITVATQMWAEPVTNLTVVGSIGERLKNCATTDTTGQQIAALM